MCDVMTICWVIKQTVNYSLYTNYKATNMGPRGSIHNCYLFVGLVLLYALVPVLHVLAYLRQHNSIAAVCSNYTLDRSLFGHVTLQ